MVSRQETARPLLTPGEIMQLPADDELVLVSGCAPIRAKKVRYFADPRLKRRICDPPTATVRLGSTVAKDEWIGRGPILPGSAAVLIDHEAEDEDGGLRRAPDLPEQVALAKEDDLARGEFAFDQETDSEDADDIASRALQTQRFRTVARSAALDPNDGIEL